MSNKVVAVLIVLVAGYYGLQQRDQGPLAIPESPTRTGADDQISNAFRQRANDLPVSGEGEVIRLLADDLDGSRHQRFIIRLGSGHTLMIAHNIDLAPRLDALDTGDSVEFSGVYEWNERGGVVHWTHHDPQGRRAGGWIKHRGRKYR
ncbi:MAG: DUF3465 domain-containing protein [Candidatus Thiodiazotropha sp. (ex Ctena orbiculata)]|uniref:DUF3465 domain-containing protein n=1 Tax=Candidatus Thiodiazotropha taylori TaxID=2792791 RepID=A0A944MB10_9GAMM|nr:DUF3465 domain-containing protein [Candidatus Thiodiazotropha taylori]MBT2989439.1 DUF3465 domain-containing protein [Candidatus Thiodiazotropha taylori]MBT2997019.1 DUF3465 domain-containing protein [Candidatus Thiodiazotropha taylori]MBT3000874.1 DUF3465 domain-containing protein [Candidatus Thiodiazotropha taylori]MBT3027011.1 DUF3465 domain-containing protein [Candidatus Thiodiazotropha taylori]